MKPLVIYHANCTDGFGAAYAAWTKLGDDADYFPVNYGKPEHTDITKLPPLNRTVYIIDFSFSKEITEEIMKVVKKFVWLDHHKTAFEMWCPEEREHYHAAYVSEEGLSEINLNNNRSGAYLAWEYFHHNVKVPMFIQHIDDRDRWQFKLSGSKEFHAAMGSYEPWSFALWDGLFPLHDDGSTDTTMLKLKTEGGAILRAHNANVREVVKHSRKCSIPTPEGAILFHGLMVNAPYFLASDAGHELATQSGTFGLVYSLKEADRVICSLRSNGDYDVSAIAKLYGGGGHKNAAGFTIPFGKFLTIFKGEHNA